MATTCADENYTVKLNTGQEDPLLGMSYFQFAIEGLRHQESQGLGDLRIPSGPRFAFYKLVDSALPKTSDAGGHENDMFDGIDTSLTALATKFGDANAVPELKKNLEKTVHWLNASATDLSNAAREFDSLHDQVDRSGLPIEEKLPLLQALDEKTKQAQAALNLALSANLEVTVAPPAGPAAPVPPEAQALTAVSPGQKFEVIAKLHNGSKYFLTTESASLNHKEWVRQTHAEQVSIAPGEDYYANFLVQLPKDAPITRPYWHRDDPQTEAVNKIDDPRYETLPFAPDPLKASIAFELSSRRGEHSLAPDFLRKKAKEPAGGTISGDVQVLYADKQGAIRRRDLAIVPQFSVELDPKQQVVPLSASKSTKVEAAVSSNLTGAPDGVLHLQAAFDWRAEPASADLKIAQRGEKKETAFEVFPQNLKESRAESRATFDAGPTKYSESYTLITREDLGASYYFQPAVQHVSVVDVETPHELKVGYIMGAGDDIPTVLEQIGMDVTLIPAEQIASENLSHFGTIVLGVRAYDTQKNLVTNNQKLLDFVSNGGTLIVQNNNSVGDFNSEHLTPYPAELGRARVSVEEAPVTILAPDNPVFRYPNQISQKDFDGWVQERGLYFMSNWDEHFTPLLSCHDPNEADQKGGLLFAKYGKGIYIYSGYAFFRQLPSGVPGAIRLFVNLVSAGKQAASH
jgi:hypothetical protein